MNKKQCYTFFFRRSFAHCPSQAETKMDKSSDFESSLLSPHWFLGSKSPSSIEISSSSSSCSIPLMSSKASSRLEVSMRSSSRRPRTTLSQIGAACINIRSKEILKMQKKTINKNRCVCLGEHTIGVRPAEPVLLGHPHAILRALMILLIQVILNSDSFKDYLWFWILMMILMILMIPGGSPQTCLALWPSGSRWTPLWRGSTPARVILLKKFLISKLVQPRICFLSPSYPGAFMGPVSEPHPPRVDRVQNRHNQ